LSKKSDDSADQIVSLMASLAKTYAPEALERLDFDPYSKSLPPEIITASRDIEDTVHKIIRTPAFKTALKNLIKEMVQEIDSEPVERGPFIEALRNL
jgi:hypothetical protein